MCDEIDKAIREAAEELDCDEETVRDVLEELDREDVEDAVAEGGGLTQLVRGASGESPTSIDEQLDDE